MALGSEPTDQFAYKVLDGADIVREAMLQQLRSSQALPDGFRPSAHIEM